LTDCTNCFNLEDSVSYLELRAATLDSNLLTIKKDIKEFNNESSQGGTLIKYTSEWGEEKLILLLYGERGSSVFEYYVSGGEVYLVRIKKLSYRESIYRHSSPIIVMSKLDTYFIVERKVIQYHEVVSQSLPGNTVKTSVDLKKLLDDVKSYRNMFSAE